MNDTQTHPTSDDLIVLGIASSETQGGGGETKEPLGKITDVGISEE